MNTLFRSLTAATVAVTIATATLAAPAEAKGRDVVAGVVLGIAAVAVASEVTRRARPVHRHRRHSSRRPRRGGCHWMKRKAMRTDSPYWWGRYDACRGR